MSDLKEYMESFKEVEGLSDEETAGLLIFLQGNNKFIREIVGIRQFIEWEGYLDAKGVIYPKIMKCLEELNNGFYSEAVLTGSIGAGKSTIALYTNVYQLYLLSCLKDPHKEFGLDPSSEIEFVFQNLNMNLAKSVDYDRFRALIDKSPYFKKYFPYNKEVKSELQFPNRIIVKPVVGTIAGTIGQNVISGILDEANAMEIVQKSKRTPEGGDYNQAEVLYTSLARRRESRFLKGGKLPGILCVVSSKRYPGEFTDRKIEEAKTDPTIYVYDKKIWEVKPEGTFSNDTFRVFVGDMVRNPRILGDIEHTSFQDQHLILEVPVDFKKQFENDILNALRDIGGASIRSAHPFLMDVEKVRQCFGTHTTILNLDSIDFSRQKIELFKNRIQNPHRVRFIHADLSLRKDHTGLVMGHVSHFTMMDRGNGNEEMLPVVHIDFVLDIIPPREGEVDYSEIRSLIYLLRNHGVNIRWVTFDSYQSADMIQQLMQKGFITGVQSVDKSPRPYIFLKTSLYDQRVRIPSHERLYDELVSLEWDEGKGKVDHKIQKSKDLSDCLAAVVYGLMIQSYIWCEHRVPILEVNKFASKFAIEEEPS